MYKYQVGCKLTISDAVGDLHVVSHRDLWRIYALGRTCCNARSHHSTSLISSLCASMLREFRLVRSIFTQMGECMPSNRSSFTPHNSDPCAARCQPLTSWQSIHGEAPSYTRRMLDALEKEGDAAV